VGGEGHLPSLRVMRAEIRRRRRRRMVKVHAIINP
jgi:hypothetical protein